MKKSKTNAYQKPVTTNMNIPDTHTMMTKYNVKPLVERPVLKAYTDMAYCRI